jgi:hypothetical protein
MSLELPRIFGPPTKFLSKRPVENAFGVVETPETSGLVPIENREYYRPPKTGGRNARAQHKFDTPF